MSERDDDEVVSLAGLPERDVDPWRRERIRARAKEVMRREASLASRWLSRLEWLYGKTLEPVIVFGVGTAYFIWAVQSVIDLLQ